MDNHLSDTGLHVPQEQMQSTVYEAPQGELEQAIAQTWQETFRLEQVGRNDNFFELGGNSLLAMELLEKLAARLDLHLPVALLFQNPTPRQLSECINSPE